MKTDSAADGEEDLSGWPLTESDALALLDRRRRLCLYCCRCCLPAGDATGGASGREAVRLVHGEAFVCTLASWFERHSVQERLLPCPEEPDSDEENNCHGGDDRRTRRCPRRTIDDRQHLASTWEAKRPIPAAFTDAEAAVPLPGRASRQTVCPGCHGVGYAGCRRCRRKGNVTCPGCHGGGGGGEGGGDSHRCFVCAGRGSVRCPACSGRVSGVECGRCAGTGRLAARRWLQANWTVTIDSALLSAADLPAGLLAEAEGRPVYRQVAPRVALSEARFPLGLVLAAEVLANRHSAVAAADVDNCRLLLQRLTVWLVPVCACEFRCGQRLFVYGQDRRQHWEKRRERQRASACVLL